MIKQFTLFLTICTIFAGAFTSVFTEPASAEYSNPYEWVGQAHNDGVLYILADLEETPSSFDEFAAHVDEKLDMFLAEQNYPDIPTEGHSPLLDELYAVVEGYDGNSLEELQQNILQLEELALTELEGDELAVFQISSSIGRHSAELWMSVDDGGLGALTQINPAVEALDIDVPNIVLSDMGGLVIGVNGGLEGSIVASSHEAYYSTNP